MRRLFFIAMIGLVIIGGASASALVHIKCAHCDGVGNKSLCCTKGVAVLVFP